MTAVATVALVLAMASGATASRAEEPVPQSENSAPATLSLTPDLAGAAAAAPVRLTYTLAQSVEQTIKTSPRIGIYTQRTLSANKDVGIAATQMMPAATLSAGRNYVRNESYGGLVDPDYLDQHVDTVSLQISQPLFAGLALLNNYQKAQLNEESARAEEQSVVSEVVRNVQFAFFDLLKSKGEVQSLRSAIKRLESNVEAVRAYERVRLASTVDVLQAEVELADAQQQLSKAENEVAVMMVTLNMLLGLPAETPVDYVDDLKGVPEDLAWTLEECLERARGQRPDLVVNRKGVAMAEKEAEIVLGRFLPRIDLQGGYVSRDVTYDSVVGIGAIDRDYRTDYWTGAINLQWRFFESGRTQLEYQRTQNQIVSLREQLRDAESQVATQVHAAFLSLNAARQRISLADKAVGQAAEGQARSQVRFEARVGTIVELLDAQARLVRAETNQLQAMADYRRALAQLNFAMGEKNPVVQF